MEHFEEFPFNIGQRIESKSNVKGYRGAWFQCEIKDIQLRRGEIWCSLQYLDFPDEKISYTKAYQQDTSDKKKRVLMLRPSYPTIYHDPDCTAINGSAGASVVIKGDWKVGDLVDWWYDGCYWAAMIIALIDKDRIKIELPKSPVGEGGTYEAAMKDIRPSLDWSVDQLWTVPCMKSQSSFMVARDKVSLEAGKKEHFFMVKQQTFKAANDRGTQATKGNTVQVKRKAADSAGTLERSNDAVHSSSHFKISKGGSRNEQEIVCSVMMDGNKLQTRISDSFNNEEMTRKSHLSSLASEIVDRQQLQAGFHESQKGRNSQDEKTDWRERHNMSVSQTSRSEVDGNEAAKQPSNYYMLKEHIPPPILDSNCKTQTKCVFPSLSNQNLDALLQEGQCLDVEDVKVGSAMMALEELVSRIVWLKGVLQLGLKGWSQEQNRKQWTVSQGEVFPVDSLKHDIRS